MSKRLEAELGQIKTAVTLLAEQLDSANSKIKALEEKANGRNTIKANRK